MRHRFALKDSRANQEMLSSSASYDSSVMLSAFGGQSFETLDFSLPSYSDAVGGAKDAIKEAPKFANPFGSLMGGEEPAVEDTAKADTKAAAEAARAEKESEKEEARAAKEAEREAARSEKEAAASRKAEEKAAAEAKKAEEKAAVEQEKADKEARRKEQLEKQREAVERAKKRDEVVETKQEEQKVSVVTRCNLHTAARRVAHRDHLYQSRHSRCHRSACPRCRRLVCPTSNCLPCRCPPYKCRRRPTSNFQR